MAGLFDFSQYDNPEAAGQLAFSAGLLNAGGPSRMPVSVGQALAQALMLGRNTATEAAQSRRRDALLGAQTQEILAQAEERKRKAEQLAKAEAAQAELQSYLGSLSQPKFPVGASIMTPWGQEKMRNPEMPQIDPLKLVAMGVPVDQAQKLATVRDWATPTVARTIERMGPNGEKIVVQLDAHGRPVGQEVKGYIPPVQVHQGDQVSFVTPMPGINLPVNMSKAERDASARGWTNIGIERQKLAEGGKPPQGYRWSANGSSLEAIPGGPADIKASLEGQKVEARRKQAADAANEVLQTITEAKDLIGYTSAGGGGYLATFPATKARTLQGKLTTIKANLGFDRLQQMREVSPTGGALGQVAVQELQALQAAVASLDQLQKPSDLKASLDKIETHYQNWVSTLSPNTGGGGGSWKAPLPGIVQDGYRFKGGNPADKNNWEKQ